MVVIVVMVMVMVVMIMVAPIPEIKTIEGPDFSERARV